MQRPPLSRSFQCCRMTCLQELKEDVRKFRKEWEVSGPMVQGISPLEAVERLRRFKEEMQLRERKVGCSWRVVLVSGCCVAVSSRVCGMSLPSHTCARWPHWSTLLRRCTPYLCSRYLGDKPFHGGRRPRTFHARWTNEHSQGEARDALWRTIIGVLRCLTTGCVILIVADIRCGSQS